MKAAGMKAAMKATMKAMKVMKAVKAMKATKTMKAMKVKRSSVVARGKMARSIVWKGSKQNTSGGLTKDTLTKSKSGKIVSKAASARAKKAFAQSALKKWGDACKKARKALNIT